MKGACSSRRLRLVVLALVTLAANWSAPAVAQSAHDAPVAPPAPGGAVHSEPTAAGAVPTPDRVDHDHRQLANEPSAPDVFLAGAFASPRNLVIVAATFALVVLTLTTIWMVFRLLSAIGGSLPIGIRAHWGGYGGSTSGWEILPGLALLIGTVVLASATAGLATVLVGAATGAPGGSGQTKVAEMGTQEAPSNTSAARRAVAVPEPASSAPAPVATAADRTAAGGHKEGDGR